MSLYENINKKRRSGRKMRNKGDKGAPTEQDFANAAKTAKMKKGGPAKNKGLKALVAAGQEDVVKRMGFDPQNLGHGGNVCSNRKKMMYGGGAKAYSTENKRYGGGVPSPRMPDPMD